MEEKAVLSQAFDPRFIEEKWYQFWEEKGCFVPPPSGPSFCIVIPPPNVTGHLHMGHALNLTLQDIVIRFRRMQGDRALWVPGTDHAGIATQNVVEKELAREGLRREDLGREKFLEKVWQWKEEYHKRIVEQIKRMGASCDWTRERFTMDEGLSRAVREVFVRLFEESLIYQDEYIVNWCPRCQTALADIEVEYEEHRSSLYYIRYPSKADPTDYLVVATTRPETMLGDVALAVHPRDQRYRHLVGKIFVLPLVGREIPLIADDYVDMEFGTGVLKVTPAHDPRDFELGAKHKLPLVKVIDAKGMMTESAKEFAGLLRETAREKVVAALEEAGLLEKIEDYTHSVGHCYRCGTVIEPLVSRQWFVRMKDLAQPAIEAVRQGKVKFVPERWAKVYFEWMENIKDWCISRQIWWGHRIPVFYCQRCDYVFTHREEPSACPRCGGAVLQDEDVLDTWFSSALWPFSTLGWPEKTPDIRDFYPTSLLVTGFDIIFFWVARMIMMGLKFMGEVPFREVYITPLVRDEKGKKMSKSLGNTVDPLGIVENYGADALRFALAWLTVQGRDIHFSLRRVEAARHFMNKLWNAARFVLMNSEDFQAMPWSSLVETFDVKDRWIVSRFHRLLRSATQALENLDFGEYVQLTYDFVWGEYCDWYVEWSKEDLYHGDARKRMKAQNLLVYLLAGIVKILHPVAPFITEEIWHNLPGSERVSLIVSPWPSVNGDVDEEAERIVALLQEIIREIRYLRAELGISPAEKCRVYLSFSEREFLSQCEKNVPYLEQLGKCDLEMGLHLPKPHQVAVGRVPGVDIYLLVEGLVDVEEEVERLSKKMIRLGEEIAQVKRKMENENFLARAPQEVVDKEKERLSRLLQEEERWKRLKEGMQ